MSKLAVVTTHPIQYNAPLFQMIAARGKIEIKVFYTWSQSQKGKIFDPGFGIAKEWDIPLLDGYDYHFSNNISKEPGSHHFSGIKNPELISELMEYDPDAILVYGWNFKSHLQVIRTFSGKKLVFFRGDSTLLDKQHIPFIKRVVKAVALKWIYGLIDKAMYTGAHNKQYFKNYGVPENKLVFMPHTVDNHRFASTSVEDIQAMRDKLNIDSNEIVCLFAGKLEPKKNPELLIQSFLKAAQANSKLIIVGNGILEEHLKKNYHDIPTIIFLPFQNQKVMPAIYAMADIFVLPSQGPEETWGLAVNEAMAAGKPVIVSDKCGCSADIVEQGKNGFVFQSGNADELSAFLFQLLLKNRDQLAQMGKRSQEIIKIWSNENAAEILENVVLNK